MEKKQYYRSFSSYLKEKYGEKVYKLPINLPISCPNREDGKGCYFCDGVGTGFEAMSAQISVTEQLFATKEKIEKRYHAHKFIAYFQNYTNTYMPLFQFEQYINEAAKIEEVVEISVSTRPDCIRGDYLEVLKKAKEEYRKYQEMTISPVEQAYIETIKDVDKSAKKGALQNGKEKNIIRK